MKTKIKKIKKNKIFMFIFKKSILKIMLFLAFIIIINKVWAEVNFNLPKNTELIIPNNVIVEGLISEKLINKKDIDSYTFDFDIDNYGNPWILINNYYLFNPIKQVMFKIDQRVSDILFMDDGELIVLSTKYIGFFSNLYNNSINYSYLNFVPVIKLPGDNKKNNIFKGGKNTIYLLSKDEKFSEIYTLIATQNIGVVKKIFDFQGKINYICGNEQNIFISTNNLIIKILIPEKDVDLFFKYKNDINTNDINTIEYYDSNTLFFSTINSAGVVNSNKKYLEFFKTTNPDMFYPIIKIKNDNLYMFFPKNFSIIIIKNLKNLKNILEI